MITVNECAQNFLKRLDSSGRRMSMLSSWQDGCIKLYITHKALKTRRSYSELFQKGEYLPLGASGGKSRYICAFLRNYRQDHALVAVPRFFTKLSEAGVMPIGERVWKDDCILLPESAFKNWLNILTGNTVQTNADGRALSIATVFNSLPVALLISYPKQTCSK